MKLKRRRNSNVPGFIVVLVIIAFVGLGLRGGRYITSHFNEKQQRDNQNISSVRNKSNKIKSLSSKYKQIKQLSDCQVIIQNSLFEQLGGRKIERKVVVELPQKTEVKTEIPQTRSSQPNYLILTGIVYLNGEPLALIEDSSKGKSYFLKKGERIRNYIVEEITGKDITLVSENSRVVQSLGSKTYFDTEGNMLASGSVTSDSSNNVQIKSMSESVLSDNNDNNLSLIEQMRNRRKKELGQE